MSPSIEPWGHFQRPFITFSMQLHLLGILRLTLCHPWNISLCWWNIQKCKKWICLTIVQLLKLGIYVRLGRLNNVIETSRCPSMAALNSTRRSFASVSLEQISISRNSQWTLNEQSTDHAFALMSISKIHQNSWSASCWLTLTAVMLYYQASCCKET